jgi:hypothetical protein
MVSIKKVRGLLRLPNLLELTKKIILKQLQ